MATKVLAYRISSGELENQALSGIQALLETKGWPKGCLFVKNGGRVAARLSVRGYRNVVVSAVKREPATSWGWKKGDELFEPLPEDESWTAAPKMPAGAVPVLLHRVDFDKGGASYSISASGETLPPATWFWPFYGREEEGELAVFVDFPRDGWAVLVNPDEVDLLAVEVQHGQAPVLWGDGTYFAGLGEVEPFDPSKHLGRIGNRGCPCGCGRWDGWAWSFPYAVAAVPKGTLGPFTVVNGSLNPPNYEARLATLPEADCLGDARFVVSDLPLILPEGEVV